MGPGQDHPGTGGMGQVSRWLGRMSAGCWELGAGSWEQEAGLPFNITRSYSLHLTCISPHPGSPPPRAWGRKAAPSPEPSDFSAENMALGMDGICCALSANLAYLPSLEVDFQVQGEARTVAAQLHTS